MTVRHLILQETSIDDLENLLDSNAKNGFKVVSLNTHHGPNINKTIYTALMVKYGSTGESDDILLKIYNKLDSMDSNLNYIETNTQK